MQELGYERFGAQGGDWGPVVSIFLGLDHPDGIIGIHLNYFADRFLPQDEVASVYLKQLRSWWDAEGGYSHEQGTKPQTLSYGLNDSPVGLAAWIVEKFRTWSDCGGDVDKVFSRDELLTIVMICCVTETIHSSCRLYYESRIQPLSLSPTNRVKPPVAFALFPKDTATAISRQTRLEYRALDADGKWWTLRGDGTAHCTCGRLSHILSPAEVGTVQLLAGASSSESRSVPTQLPVNRAQNDGTSLRISSAMSPRCE